MGGLLSLSGHRTGAHKFKDSYRLTAAHHHIIKLANKKPRKQELHSIIIAIKQRNLDTLEEVLLDVSSPDSPNYRQHWTTEQIAHLTSNTKGQNRVKQCLLAYGLTIDEESLYGDFLKVSGTIQQLEATFATTFYRFAIQQNDQSKQATTIVNRAEEYSLPIDIYSEIETVLHLIDLPTAASQRSHRHYHPRHQHHPQQPAAVYDAASPDVATADIQQQNPDYINHFKVDDVYAVSPALLTSYYNITNTTGNAHVTQAVYESLGSILSPSDLLSFQKYFQLHKQAIAGDIGGHVANDACTETTYYYPYYGDLCGEPNLDTQYIMAIAQYVPTYYDYYAGSFSQWLYSVANMQSPYNVYSISYGDAENDIYTGYVTLFNTQAMKLGVNGVSILVSSGDDGVADSSAANNSRLCGYNPSWPASSPYVTAVGATVGPEANKAEVACQANVDGAIITSGGGFSTKFPASSFQLPYINSYFTTLLQEQGRSPYQGKPNQTITEVNTGNGDDYTQALVYSPYYNRSNRGYPDVSLLGHNYAIMENDQLALLDGTSASAPVFAGMVSLVNSALYTAKKQKMGWLNPFLYQYSASFVHDITVGNNSCTSIWNFEANGHNQATCCQEGFLATTGWDPVTGLGSINFKAFKQKALAVTPNAPTPPPTASPVISSASRSLSYDCYSPLPLLLCIVCVFFCYHVLV